MTTSPAWCYIVRCADGTLYTGWTTNPVRRLRAHNAGCGARYTRSRRPVQLVYLEACPDRSAALRRERQIKQMSRKQKEALIASASLPFPLDDTNLSCG
jgi:putative endonuclease